MQSGPALFRLLGDDARLRVLRLLDAERLNVSELTAILGIAQSGVSRHLGLLKDAGLVEEQRDGGFTVLPARPGAPGGPQRLRAGVAAAPGALRVGLRDACRSGRRCAAGGGARGVRKENFDAHAGPDTRRAPARARPELGGVGARARAPAAAARVADLGCGDGYLTIEASRWAARVIAVDRSRRRARARARRSPTARPRIERHLEARRARAAAARGCRRRRRAALPGAAPRAAIRRAPSPKPPASSSPGGRVLRARFARARREWVRERLGDRWLGFSRRELSELLARRRASSEIKVTVGARRTGDPFTVLIASGVKPTPETRPSGRATQESPEPRPEHAEHLELAYAQLRTRILVLDGAMGTMIQRYKLTEADFRGERSGTTRTICRATATC